MLLALTVPFFAWQLFYLEWLSLDACQPTRAGEKKSCHLPLRRTKTMPVKYVVRTVVLTCRFAGTTLWDPPNRRVPGPTLAKSRDSTKALGSGAEKIKANSNCYDSLLCKAPEPPAYAKDSTFLFYYRES